MDTPQALLRPMIRAQLALNEPRGAPCALTDGMVQCGTSLSHSLKAGQGLWVSGNFIGQKLQGDKRCRVTSSALYTTPIPSPQSFSTMR
jgi:hypothetical protein